MNFEYKVVPAPTRGRRAKGVKTPADRFAFALEETINECAQEGWEYLRTDTLPAEERQGLTGRTTVYQNMLVFRRPVAATSRETERTATVPTPPAPPKAPETPVAPAVPTAGAQPSAREPGAATGTSGDDRPDTPQRAALKTLIEQELAAARAPKLPSADAAQDLSAARTGPALPKLTASRKDMAAE
ncbi:MAG: DUF4177 domain-containing protein [Maritimibacter sp.]|nr:DUF4177 domain-containing protein [Maritimibacter sp.]